MQHCTKDYYYHTTTWCCPLSKVFCQIDLDSDPEIAFLLKSKQKDNFNLLSALHLIQSVKFQVERQTLSTHPYPNARPSLLYHSKFYRRLPKPSPFCNFIISFSWVDFCNKTSSSGWQNVCGIDLLVSLFPNLLWDRNVVKLSINCSINCSPLLKTNSFCVCSSPHWPHMIISALLGHIEEERKLDPGPGWPLSRSVVKWAGLMEVSRDTSSRAASSLAFHQRKNRGWRPN